MLARDVGPSKCQSAAAAAAQTAAATAGGGCLAPLSARFHSAILRRLQRPPVGSQLLIPLR